MTEIRLSDIHVADPAPDAFVLGPDETLVIKSYRELTMAEVDMMQTRLVALGVQFVILGPNYTAISEPTSARTDPES